MRLEHYPEEKLKKEILEIVGEHLDLKKYKVFFFGSWVSGKETSGLMLMLGLRDQHLYLPELLSILRRFWGWKKAM